MNREDVINLTALVNAAASLAAADVDGDSVRRHRAISIIVTRALAAKAELARVVEHIEEVE